MAYMAACIGAVSPRLSTSSFVASQMSMSAGITGSDRTRIPALSGQTPAESYRTGQPVGMMAKSEGLPTSSQAKKQKKM